MNFKNKILILVGTTLLSSCTGYLDVVPDDVATIDHAFTDKESTEKFLFTCYSYLPNPADVHNTPAYLCGYESWPAQDGQYYFQLNSETLSNSYAMGKSGQNSNKPYFNHWSGGNGGNNLWIAIRDCNIFLENIDKPSDIDETMRKRWIAEVKFLKAYYHYYLFRQYGPIPLVEQNIEVSSGPDAVKVYREPVDEVVQYISDLLDETVADLPDKIENETDELGRITQPAALALKAKVWLLAASPLFNGNSYYTHIKDSRGVSLFPAEFDVTKWEKAATYTKEAIDIAESAGVKLYEYDKFDNFTDSTRQKLVLRYMMTDKWNRELIWGSTKGTQGLQQVSAGRTAVAEQSTVYCISMLSPTFATVERFYTNNGLPIDEDKTWDYSGRYKTYQVKEDERFYMDEGYTTAMLNHAREPRFYASLIFDGCLFYGKGKTNVASEKDFFSIQMKKGQPGGMNSAERYSYTGYLPKKVLNVETSWEGNNKWTTKNYSFPIIRLADLYLMYAEALNEVALAKGAAVPDDVYTYIDYVRKRAGLKGVKESWSTYSTKPTKPDTPDGMQEIIRQERMNELVFEGQGYWDMLRWKKAETEFKKPVLGWNVLAGTAEEYYEVTTLFYPSFGIKDYLTPIKLYDMDRNSNLVQNFGW